MYKIIGADQKEYGPISADQIRQWITEGRINGNTNIQAEGTGVWKRAAEFPEFAAAVPVAPPPLHASPITMGPTGTPPKTNLMAVWSLIMGAISVIPCCWLIFFGIVPIVLGGMALSQIKKTPQQTGAGLAITGIVLGSVTVIISIIVYLFGSAIQQFLQNLPNAFPH